MPLHEYECKEHGVFEALRKTSDENIEEYHCPVCKVLSKKVAVPSIFGFTFGKKVRVAKSVDIAIGKASEKAWRHHYERKEKRNKS